MLLPTPEGRAAVAELTNSLDQFLVEVYDLDRRIAAHRDGPPLLDPTILRRLADVLERWAKTRRICKDPYSIVENVTRAEGGQIHARWTRIEELLGTVMRRLTTGSEE